MLKFAGAELPRVELVVCLTVFVTTLTFSWISVLELSFRFSNLLFHEDHPHVTLFGWRFYRDDLDEEWDHLFVGVPAFVLALVGHSILVLLIRRYSKCKQKEQVITTVYSIVVLGWTFGWTLPILIVCQFCVIYCTKSILPKPFTIWIPAWALFVYNVQTYIPPTTPPPLPPSSSATTAPNMSESSTTTINIACQIFHHSVSSQQYMTHVIKQYSLLTAISYAIDSPPLCKRYFVAEIFNCAHYLFYLPYKLLLVMPYSTFRTRFDQQQRQQQQNPQRSHPQPGNHFSSSHEIISRNHKIGNDPTSGSSVPPSQLPSSRVLLPSSLPFKDHCRFILRIVCWAVLYHGLRYCMHTQAVIQLILDPDSDEFIGDHPLRSNNIVFACLCFMLGIEFHLKYTVLFGIPTIFARMDGLEPYPLPICVSTVADYRQIWRSFDPGLHAFFTAHIYRPICGPDYAWWKKAVATSFVFFVVLIWHGIEKKTLMFCLLNLVVLVLTNQGSSVLKGQQIKEDHPQKKTKKTSGIRRRRLIGLVMIPLLYLSVNGFVYFLYFDHTAGEHFYRQFVWNTSPNLSYFLVIPIFYCYAQMSIQTDLWFRLPTPHTPIS